MSRLMLLLGTMSRLRMSVKVKRMPVLPLLALMMAELVAVRPVRKKPVMLSGMMR